MQRCSPLPQTYGKSAGMVSGHEDHICDRDILFWSVHSRLAAAANSRARFCCKPVSAKADTLRPDLRSSRFRARSRCLQSLGAFGRKASWRAKTGAHLNLVHAHFILAHAHFIQTLKPLLFQQSFTDSLQITVNLNGFCIFSGLEIFDVHSVHSVPCCVHGLAPRWRGGGGGGCSDLYGSDQQ
jgi:hypothetical protein